MFTECLDRLPKTLGEFVPCPRASRREEFAAIPSGERALAAKRGEAAKAGKWELLTACDWLRFSRTGDRRLFEQPYFLRRRRLNDLILAECVQYEGQYLDEIINGLWLLCEESAWQVPAHNSYVRDAPQLPLPLAECPVLDLFACETGALLAMALHLLGDEIEAAAPGITGRILYELNRRIIAPYQSEHFWWMGNGEEQMNNWTSWCTQNVLLCVFLTPQSDKTRRECVKKAALSLDCFLNGYGQDGCCCEGPQYYRHAGLALFGAMLVLESAAPEAFGGLWGEEKIRNIAEYIYQTHVGGDYYINFGDCSPVAGQCTAREYLFGKKTGSAALMAFAAEDCANPKEESDNIKRINLFYCALSLFAAGELLRARGLAQIAAGNIYYESTGLWIARDSVFCLAVKAGGNGDSHNHNDTGSITLYKQGRPFLIDLGVETYSRKTFSDERYDIWSMQSAWHNLPTFDGVMQSAGVQFCSEEVLSEFLPEHSRISMSLAGAWPKNARLESFRRSVTLHHGRQIVVDDICTGEYENAVLTLLFEGKPEADGGCIRVGDLGAIRVSGFLDIQISSFPVLDARLRIAWPDTLYRAQIAFKSELRLEIE